MDIDKPFTDAKGIDEHALKLRLARDIHTLRFENHWRALGDKDVRGTLFKGAVRDAVHDFKPAQKAKELLMGGGIASQLAFGMLSRKGGLFRRLLMTGLTMAAPGLLKNVPWQKLAGLVTGKEHAQNGHTVNGGDHAQRS